MSENRNPLASTGAGIMLGLALVSVIVSVAVQPESVALEVKFQYVFAALFLGISIGHFLGEALISSGEDKKYALVGLFSTLGIMFAAFLVYGQGATLFSAGIGGTLGSFASCLILSHHSGLITDSEQLDRLVDVFAGKVSPSGLAALIIAFIADLAFGQEVADAVLQIALVTIAVLLAFYILKYRDPILREVRPLIEELKGDSGGKEPQ